MRNIIIIALIILGITNAIGADYDKDMKKGVDYAEYTGLATDTINTSTTVDAVFWVRNGMSRYTIGYTISIDTLLGGGGDAITFQPQGSYDGTAYSNIGSAVTWAAAASVDTNITLNTYTKVNASHTETMSGNSVVAAYNIWTVDSLLYDDTLHVPAQTTTDARVKTVAAQTTTITLPGVDYKFIKILLTGGGAARAEVDLIGLKTTPVEAKEY